MQWHVRSVEAPERLYRQAMEEEGEGGAHLPRLLSFSSSPAAPPAGRANKAMQWPMRALDMAGVAAEAVTTAAEE
jgi:hypothetical protein